MLLMAEENDMEPRRRSVLLYGRCLAFWRSRPRLLWAARLGAPAILVLGGEITSNLAGAGFLLVLIVLSTGGYSRYARLPKDTSARIRDAAYRLQLVSRDFERLTNEVEALLGEAQEAESRLERVRALHGLTPEIVEGLLADAASRERRQNWIAATWFVAGAALTGITWWFHR
jgi:hypothetical protein